MAPLVRPSHIHRNGNRLYSRDTETLSDTETAALQSNEMLLQVGPKFAVKWGHAGISNSTYKSQETLGQNIVAQVTYDTNKLQI